MTAGSKDSARRSSRSAQSASRRAGGAGRDRRNASATEQPPVRVGDQYELTVERLGYRGEGVARHEGFTVFVDGALPGERVQARVTRVARSFAHAQLCCVLTPSVERVSAPCPVYELCGGCQLQHLSDAAQLRFKRQAVIDALTRIGKFPALQMEAVVRATLGMEQPWRYRNKVQVAAAARGGRFVVGFVEEGTHEPVEASTCLIRPEVHDQLLALTLALAERFALQAYDESTGQGDVFRITIRTTTSGDALLVLTTVRHRLPQAEEFAQALAEKVELLGVQAPDSQQVRLAGVVQQAGATWSRVLWGVPYVQETISGLVFRVSADSFLQVNPLQTERLYEEALQVAALTPSDSVWDLYCGIGTLSLLAARSSKRVVGIEEVASAVADAKDNAVRNGLANAHFIAQSVEAAMADLVEQEGQPDVVLLDPPRAGCAPEVIAALVAASPRRIVYVSCNPATLARDLRLLADGGYELASAQPVDMFPQTAHVECVVGLMRSF